MVIWLGYNAASSVDAIWTVLITSFALWPFQVIIIASKLFHPESPVGNDHFHFSMITANEVWMLWAAAFWYPEVDWPGWCFSFLLEDGIRWGTVARSLIAIVISHYRLKYSTVTLVHICRWGKVTLAMFVQSLLTYSSQIIGEFDCQPIALLFGESSPTVWSPCRDLLVCMWQVIWSNFVINFAVDQFVNTSDHHSLYHVLPFNSLD